MKQKTGLIWMSAGNSYFKEDIIKEIMNYALKEFDKLIILAPDEPAEHTYLVLGYPKNRAKRKSKLNANLLQNRAKRIKDSLNKENQEKIHIVEWIDEIIPNKQYQDSYKNILNLFKSNKEFQKDALDNAKKVIETKGKELEKEAPKQAVYYLLKELAFLTTSPEIYNTDSISYIYHKPWPIYKKYIKGYYDKKPKDNLKFVLHEG